MTPATKGALARCSHSETRARYPNLSDKAGTVDDILHQRLARREQRRLSRLRAADEARRLARVEVEVEALGAQVTLDSIVIGTTKAHLTPEPGVITRETRLSDEATCAALADIRSCGRCGWSGTGGSCWCPRRTS